MPTQFSNDLIPRLYQEAVVTRMPGVRYVTQSSPSLTFPSVESGASISWGSEAETINEDTSTSFGQKSLELKKAVCLLKVSSELLEDTGSVAEDELRAELVRSMAEELDTVILRGTGGQKPLGIYYHPGKLNTDLSGSIGTADIVAAETQVRQQNGRVTGWVCDPSVIEDFRLLVDGVGRPIFNQENMIGSHGVPIENFSIFGKPVKDTTVIGTGNYPDASETFVVGGDWSQLMVGTSTRGMRLEANAGPYFTTDQMALRLVYRVGHMLRQPKTFVVISGIS